ncbi:MAG TPA: UDP-3-O-acyl-N-acetylglucosamine deacetylase [Terriglobia bacterium]|nr:UDP-3-O-acyl-N-acetylglucosamine deacetylase [Terriglobia bacterium]
MAYQHTIARPVEVSGIGLHSAVPVTVRLVPAAANRGVVFRRTDLDNFEIPASWKHIARVSYATSLMRQGVLISTTEHILSALMSMEIDNVVIEINALELPILDGSCAPWVRLLEQAGRRRQRAGRLFLRVRQPVEVVEGSKRISLLPDSEFRISTQVNFPHPKVGLQQMETAITPEIFAREIAPARTFGFLDQLPQMRDMGLIRGGSLENAVVFDRDSVMNPEGLRFPDECCRHKLLDLIGDLALVGHPLRGRVIAEHAGHAMHTALVLKLMRDRSLWELTTSEPASASSPPQEALPAPPVPLHLTSAGTD